MHVKHRALVWACILSLGAPAARATCPAYLEGRQLPESWLGTPHEAIKFVVREGQTLVEKPLDIDGLTQRGLLTAFDSKLPLGPGLQKYDRLVLAPEAFGPARSETLAWPCATSEVVTLSSPRDPKRRGYLLRCLTTTTKTDFALPVAANKAQRTLQSSQFLYQYHPANLLLFDAIKINLDPWQELAGDADMLLHMDLKSFFTFNLDRDDMSAQLLKELSGGMGISYRIAFFIHILFFKIDLKLGTLFSFFESSAHAPMMFSMPDDAERHLHTGSGMLLHWQPRTAQFDPTESAFTMPLASPKLIMQGPRALSQEGLKRCSAETCRYVLPLTSHGAKFRIQTTIARRYVELGFFPQFIPDTAAFVKEMHWNVNSEPLAGRVGIFFDNTHLPKGEHKIDHWFYRLEEQDSQAAALTCPQELLIEAP